MRVRGVVVLVVAACGRLHFGAVGGGGGGAGNGDGGPGDSATGDGFVAASDAPVANGSRLRARHWTTSDGTSRFADWYDTLLAMPCSFSADASGTQRCYPNSAFAEAFTDSACGTRAIRAGAGCSATPTFATQDVASVNGAYSVAYPVGSTLATAYVRGFICQQASDGAAYFNAGAAVTDTMFVAASSNVAPLLDGFARIELVAEDGSAQPLGFTYMGAPCTPQSTGGTSGVCIPSGSLVYATASTYANSGCTGEIVAGIASPAPPFVTIERTSAPCRPLRYVQTGVQTTPTTVYYRNSAGTCASFTPTAGTVYTAITDATSTLPVLTHVIDTGSARLRTTAWVSPGGARLEDRLYDSQTSLACDPVTDSTGVTACAPLGIDAAAGWTNAQCNQPAPQAQLVCDGDNTVGLLPYVFAFGGPKHNATCDGPASTLLVYSTPVSGTGYTKNEQSNCVAMDLTGGALFSTTSSTYSTTGLVMFTLQ